MHEEDERLFIEAYRFLATSDSGAAKAVRTLYKKLVKFSIPAPRAIYKPMWLGYWSARSAYSFGKRVFVCQPMIAAYATRCGKNFRTGEFLHWVQGHGDLVIGDDVLIDGKCTITFAVSFGERPTLEIGDGTGIGHDTEFSIGKRITIGKNCIISGASRIFDSNGHPSDPDERRTLKAPPADQVRPVTIGDDVWMGKDCIIFPGVRVGNAAIISAGSVVRRHVPPYTVVAGNPAQVVLRLPGAPKPGAHPPPPAGANGAQG
jgi:acetyltransferase-like isoleucine patch superfamily enzyme